MKQFFKSMRWYNWGGIIPAVVFFNSIVMVFGINPNVGWANVVGCVLVIFQISCIGLIIRAFLLERRREKQQDAAFEKKTDELREQYKRKRAVFDELQKEIMEEESSDETP